MRGIYCFVQISLVVLLLGGYEIQSTQAIDVGGTCTTNGVLTADPDDNTHFFFCLDNTIYAGSCTDGKIFNSALSQCVDPSNGTPVNPGTNIGTDVQCEGNDYATFPFPNDNSKYYYCLNGEAMIVQCPSNSYYDPYTRSCSQNNGGIDFYCPTGMNTLFADPNGNCARYVLCLNGEASFMTCPSGYFFQPKTGNCGPNIPDSCNQGGPCTRKQVGLVKQVQNNCEVYQECDNSTLTWKTRKCQKNYYFNPNRLQCGPIRPAGCGNYNYYDQNLPGYDNTYNPYYPIYPGFPTGPTNPGVICGTSLNGLFADPSNCRNYIYCIDGVAHSMTCLSGFYFNPLTRICGPNIPSGCSVQNIDIDLFTCPAFADITVADPSNCKQYIVCSGGVSTTYGCGPGLYYYPDQNTCSTLLPARCRF